MTAAQDWFGGGEDFEYAGWVGKQDGYSEFQSANYTAAIAEYEDAEADYFSAYDCFALAEDIAEPLVDDYEALVAYLNAY